MAKKIRVKRIAAGAARKAGRKAANKAAHTAAHAAKHPHRVKKQQSVVRAVTSAAHHAANHEAQHYASQQAHQQAAIMRAANQQPKVESTKAQLAREAREYRKLNPPHENRTLGDVLHRLPQDLGLEGLKKPQGPISVHPPTPGEVLDQALLAVPAEGIAAKAGRLLLRARRGERTAAEAERSFQAERAAAKKSGPAHAEERAAARSRGEKVKPHEKAPRSLRERASAKRTRTTRSARAKRSPDKLRKPATTVARHPKVALAHAGRRASLSAQGLPIAAKTKAFHLAAGGALGSVPVVTAVTEGAKREATGFAEKPGRTLSTTLRTAEGIPAATLGIGADAVESVRHGTTEPLRGQLAQQERYLKQYSNFIGTPDEAKARRIVQNRLGLIPAASVGLTGLSLAKLASRTRPGVRVGEALSRDEARKGKKLVRRSADATTSLERREARHKAEEGQTTEGPRKAQKRRRAESERGSRRERMVGAHEHREMRKRGKRSYKGRENYYELVGRMNRNRIGQIGEGDVVHYLARHGYREDTKDVLAKVKRNHEAHAKAGRALPEDTPHTRLVEQTILDHPEILASKDLRRAADSLVEISHGRSVERHEVLTGKPQTAPNPADERATFLPVQRAEGIHTGSERIPHELRDTGIKVKPRTGHSAEKVIRGTAKNFQRKARSLRTSATELRKAGRTDRADKLEERADIYDAKAQERLNVTDRFRRAERLDHQAAKAQAEGNAAHAKELRAQAQELRAAGERAQTATHAEAMKATREVMARENIHEPAFARQTDVAEGRSASVPQQFPGAETPRKAKFRTGALEAKGRVDESAEALLENLHRDRINLAGIEATRDFLTNIPFTHKGQRFFTGDALRVLRREGQVPDGFVDVPVQEFAGTVQHVDSLRKELADARHQANVDKLKGAPTRKLYVAVPRSSIQEFRAQYENVNKGLRAVRTIGRVQQGAMIATSPTWFAFQLPASPFAILARNWSPTRYARVIGQSVEVWRHASDRQKADFDANLGANSGNLLEIGESHSKPTVESINSMSSAIRFAFRSPLGRFVHDVGKLLRGGGPLIRANVRYENAVRRFGALMEMDRLAGLNRHGKPTVSSHLVRSFESFMRLNDTVYRHQDAMRGLKPHERPSFYNTHPKEAAELDRNLSDAMGDWGSLSSKERVPAAFTVFYPFVRFSLRWYLASMPKNNPLKYAIMLNLAQSNDVELQKVLGGRPDFLQTFGTVVTHTGQGGAAKTGISVVRAAPGGNAIIEALASGKIDLSTLVKPTQPLIGGTLLGLAGQTAFGTTPATGTSKLDLIARNVTSLSPLTRTLTAKIGPDPSTTALLFRAIEQHPNTVAENVIPQTTMNLRRERDVVRLQALLNTAYGDGPDTYNDVKLLPVKRQEWGQKVVEKKKKAKAEIAAMKRAYGVETAADQNKTSQTYVKRTKKYTKKYGIFGTGPPKPAKSSTGLSGGGLSGGGLSGGGL